MEKLFFMLQKNKQLKRQIQILKYLETTLSTTSIPALARELDCSSPTLRSDISALNMQLPPSAQIVIHAREGIQLIYDKATSVDTHIANLAKQSVAFQIIDNIFHNNIYTFQEATEILYLSKSSLRKFISHINQIMKEFHISISMRSLDFIGKEADIRFFLFVYYCDFRDCFLTYAEDDHYAKDYISLLISARGVKLPRLHFSYFRSTIWLMIIKGRITNQKLITLDKDLIAEFIGEQDFENFNQIYTNFFYNNFSLDEFPVEEAIFSYVVCLHSISYSAAYPKIANAEPHCYCRKTDPRIIEKVNTFLSNIFPKELIGTPALERIQAFLINLRLLTKITSQFELTSYPLQEVIQDSYPELYQAWYALLKKLPPEVLFPIEHRRDVAVTLTIMQASILSEKKEHKSIFILFSFQGELGYDDILVHDTKALLSDNMKTEYHFEKAVDKDLIEKTQADLVVCNYDLPDIVNCPCPIVRLSYIPTTIDWRILKNKLHDLASM